MLLTGQRAVPARLERAGFTFAFDTIDAAMNAIVRC
jgi:NAD dependent epimerase/dehydratase family enzyme